LITIDAKELAIEIAQLLDEKKAIDVQVLDISNLTTVCDFFVIASGRTELQVRALSDELEKNLALKEFRAWHKEGYRKGRWVVLDYKDVVVHLFHKDERAFYNLERLWADGLRLGINNLG
jgi:ribosome-associated protein